MTYGSGKTHTMVTLTHLVRDPDALPALPAVQEFESSMGGKAPRSRVAAVCFDKIDAEMGALWSRQMDRSDFCSSHGASSLGNSPGPMAFE